jgi:hypothetical protein
MAYATVDELAAALRITVTTANQATLQGCLDAAAAEIDASVDADPTTPIDPADPLANRVNVLRGVEWFKSNDAAFGVIGSADTGVLTAPKSGFARHQATLVPLQQGFGVG